MFELHLTRNIHVGMSTYLSYIRAPVMSSATCSVSEMASLFKSKKATFYNVFLSGEIIWFLTELWLPSHINMAADMKADMEAG